MSPRRETPARLRSVLLLLVPGLLGLTGCQVLDRAAWSNAAVRGMKAEREERWSDAVAHRTIAYEVARRLGTEEEADAVRILAEDEFRQGNGFAALEHFDRAHELYGKLPGTPPQTRMGVGIYRFFLRAGTAPGPLLEVLAELLPLAREHMPPGSAERRGTWPQLIGTLAGQGLYHAAFPLQTEYLAELESSGADPVELVDAHRVDASLAGALGAYPAQLAALQRARALLAKLTPPPPEKLQSLLEEEALAALRGPRPDPGTARAKLAELVTLRNASPEEARLSQEDLLDLEGEIAEFEGRWQDAVGLRRKRFEMVSARVPLEETSHAEALPRLWAHFDLGFSLLGRGERREAWSEFQAVRGKLLDLLGPEHVQYAPVLQALGQICLEQGDLDPAEKLLEQARPLRAMALGEQETRCRSLERLRVRLALARGQGERALELAEAHVTALGGRDPAGSRERARADLLMAEVQGSRGEHAEALALARRAHRVLESIHPERSPQRAEGFLGLGKALLGAGQAQEAMPLLHRALELRKLALVPEHPDYLRTQEALATCLEALGQGAAAGKLRGEIEAAESHRVDTRDWEGATAE